MEESTEAMNLMQAASLYLGEMAPGEAGENQKAIGQFIRWFGRQQLINEITAEEITNYAQRMSTSDAENQKKLGIIRSFLAYAKKAGWTRKNMAVHLKAKKSKTKKTAAGDRVSKPLVSLTQQGYQKMENELKELKDRRPQIVEEIKKAAADKDFRENAPLHAAKERLGHLEGRIIKLEETLKAAVVIDQKSDATQKVSIGDSVVLLDLSRNEEISYKIVSPREVDPARGRISNASPIGKAIIGCQCGEIIEIEAPVGRLRYRLEKVGR